MSDTSLSTSPSQHETSSLRLEAGVRQIHHGVNSKARGQLALFLTAVCLLLQWSKGTESETSRETIATNCIFIGKIQEIMTETTGAFKRSILIL